MRLIISFAALLVSITFLQLSSGAIGPLDALSGLQLNFSTTMIGLLGSAHFLGFFVGCWWSPRLIGSVGHSRAFAIFASFGAIGAMAHPLIMDPMAWTGFRVLTGMCVAGCYTVIEAWFQAKLTNANRGRIMGAYRAVDIGASALAQTMIGFLEPANYVSYNILAILACASLLPLALSKSSPPAVEHAPRLHPLRTLRMSPLGVAGVLVAAVTSASFRMVSPVYAAEIGLTPKQIGSFLAIVLVGGAIAQLPVGWLADKFNRRSVLTGLSCGGVVICAAMAQVAGPGNTLFVLAFLFGLITFPIFSVAASHANDLTPPEARVELNASLIFFFGAGAIFAPIGTASLIDIYGSTAFFIAIGAVHVLLAGFGVLRALVGPVAKTKTRYRYTPRTSPTIARLLRRDRPK